MLCFALKFLSLQVSLAELRFGGKSELLRVQLLSVITCL